MRPAHRSKNARAPPRETRHHSTAPPDHAEDLMSKSYPLPVPPPASSSNPTEQAEMLRVRRGYLEALTPLQAAELARDEADTRGSANRARQRPPKQAVPGAREDRASGRRVDRTPRSARATPLHSPHRPRRHHPRHRQRQDAASDRACRLANCRSDRNPSHPSASRPLATLRAADRTQRSPRKPAARSDSHQKEISRAVEQQQSRSRAQPRRGMGG